MYFHEAQFNELFLSYKDKVYGFILLMVKDAVHAEELTQEVFLKLWLCRDTLQDVVNLQGYIFTIAKHKTLNHLRKVAYNEQLLKELSVHMKPVVNDVEETVIAKEYVQLLNDGLAQLSVQQRKIYEMSRQGGLTHDQIAAQLNISRNTVKNHLVKSLAFLRQYLLEHTTHASIILTFLLMA
ncbi:RNA polymerase sigma-70 factor [Chitinophaga silvatica]|uniref:RNA polymerase sigma-70 factor n=1 Tax=Chitinophaga silvatica TaxID=2282649 RepID=A0A3E1Y716_9BACT|nr:RNA polymerase sigma-70 factor [Chitinophaga silvatica]RFS20688.1 RNA polymerase sigma-70 factor [Chitinophaga silvatica]